MTHLRVLDLRGDRSDPSARLPRPAVDLAATRARVHEVLDAVRSGGDEAIRGFTQRFDGVTVDDLEVPRELLRSALDELDPTLRTAIERAARQVRRFHEHARPADWSDSADGVTFGQRHVPLRRVGAYVPGGLAAYPSTVVMTAVPARVAGVDEIVLCSPPRDRDGWPDRTVLATAALLGVDRVFRVGGAQAIAALAYGSASVPACDKIVGPGNRFVAAAKLEVQAEGACGIDGFAGPTEIVVVADADADADLIAADLIAQAEHDELATCILITAVPGLVADVERALASRVAGARHRERIEAALAGQGTAVLVDDTEHALDVVERFAPEHLELHVGDAASLAERIRCAGAVFVGATTPVSLGDYAAGPNHTLPTARTARFRGGLTTGDFLVTVNHVRYDAAALAELAPTVDALAAAEDLPAHAAAVRARLGPP